MAGNRGTEEVFLKGKFKYMHHLRPNPRFPDKWNVLFFPDEEGIQVIKALKKQGVQNHLKMDDKGDGWCINFSRPIERDWSGKKEAMEAPKVIFPDKSPVEVRVGDGSDGIISLEVYQHKTDIQGQYKKAARWRGARIDNLIPFNAETDYTEEEKAEIKTLSEVPEQLF